MFNCNKLADYFVIVQKSIFHFIFGYTITVIFLLYNVMSTSTFILLVMSTFVILFSMIPQYLPQYFIFAIYFLKYDKLFTIICCCRCKMLCMKLAKYVSDQPDCDWSTVCMSVQWVEWSKLALKYGEDPLLDSAFLLTALTKVSIIIMKHNTQMVASICEMIFSHSKFLIIMLGHSKHKGIVRLMNNKY